MLWTRFKSSSGKGKPPRGFISMSCLKPLPQEDRKGTGSKLVLFQRGYKAIEGVDFLGCILSFGISYGPLIWALSLFKRL